MFPHCMLPVCLAGYLIFGFVNVFYSQTLVLMLFPLKSLQGTPSDLNSVGSISVSKDCWDAVMKKLAL